MEAFWWYCITQECSSKQLGKFSKKSFVRCETSSAFAIVAVCDKLSSFLNKTKVYAIKIHSYLSSSEAVAQMVWNITTPSVVWFCVDSELNRASLNSGKIHRYWRWDTSKRFIAKLRPIQSPLRVAASKWLKLQVEEIQKQQKQTRIY